MTTVHRSPFPTIAGLLRDLGDVPADRVRLTPSPGTATPADLHRPENEGCELVDGTLVEKTMGEPESMLGSWIGTLITNFAVPRKLGYCTDSQGFFTLPGVGSVRGPDVAFVAWKSLPGGKRTGDAFPEVAPDLVVEVLSPSNSRGEMARKRREYFKAGVVRVWEVEPRARIVCVYSSPTRCKVLEVGHTLNAAPVLPGLKIELAELFSALDWQG